MKLSEINELFIITSEECAELSVAIAKIMRFGQSKKNINNLKQEIGDVTAMIGLMMEYGILTDKELEECIMKKLKKLKKYSSLKIDL